MFVVGLWWRHWRHYIPTIRRCRLTGFILTTAWVGSRSLPFIRRFSGWVFGFFLAGKRKLKSWWRWSKVKWRSWKEEDGWITDSGIVRIHYSIDWYQLHYHDHFNNILHKYCILLSSPSVDHVYIESLQKSSKRIDHLLYEMPKLGQPTSKLWHASLSGSGDGEMTCQLLLRTNVLRGTWCPRWHWHDTVYDYMYVISQLQQCSFNGIDVWSTDRASKKRIIDKGYHLLQDYPGNYGLWNHVRDLRAHRTGILTKLSQT